MIETSLRSEELKIRIQGDESLPTMIYLPGLHGDWTLASSFRKQMTGHVRFVEITYPRTTSWSLENYATAIETVLLRNKIREGWLLAESFGSQIAWTLADRKQQRGGFEISGIILAGGFVKHPNIPGIAVAKQLLRKLPDSIFQSGLRLYARYAHFRHRNAPETLASISEFVERRSQADREAMVHRLDLLKKSSLEPIACNISIPVFAISGFWDPIVPRRHTRRWLERNCPGFRGAHTVFRADHNVLGTAPQQAAEIIMQWVHASEASESCR